jgi:E3 ubiquitin-protein ligase TRIP12
MQNGLSKGVWSGVYTVHFKKVPGPSPTSSELSFLSLLSSRGSAYERSLSTLDPSAKEGSPEPSTKEPSSATALPDSVSPDSPQAKILRLLRVLHALNSNASEVSKSQTLPESAFVNNKLTAKLGRQLEEPMILARYTPFISFSFEQSRCS